MGRPVIEPGAQLVGELRAALQQPAVQVEHVTGVGLATRRAAQQQRHGPVGLGLLGQVVEHDQHVLARVHPVLADGRAGVRSHVLVAGRVRGGGVHDRRVRQGAGLFEHAAQCGDGRALLTDRHVDAAHLLLRIAALPELALVDDGVHRDGGLAGLAVADDQLPLTATDRDHRVDGLDAGLQRLTHLLAVHHAGGLELQRSALVDVGDVTEPVDGPTQRIDGATEVALTHRAPTRCHRSV